MGLDDDIALVLIGVAQRLLDPNTPVTDRRRLAGVLRPLLDEHDERVTREARQRADDARRLRRRNAL